MLKCMHKNATEFLFYFIYRLCLNGNKNRHFCVSNKMFEYCHLRAFVNNHSLQGVVCMNSLFSLVHGHILI